MCHVNSPASAGFIEGYILCMGSVQVCMRSFRGVHAQPVAALQWRFTLPTPLHGPGTD